MRSAPAKVEGAEPVAKEGHQLVTAGLPPAEFPVLLPSTTQRTSFLLNNVIGATRVSSLPLNKVWPVKEKPLRFDLQCAGLHMAEELPLEARADRVTT